MNIESSETEKLAMGVSRDKRLPEKQNRFVSLTTKLWLSVVSGKDAASI